MNTNPAKRTNVFFNRSFRLVFLGALVSELGALLYSFAVGFYILQISNNNAFLQGLYLALCGIALLVFTPVGGVLGDRFNKAKIMYVCDFIKGGIIILATVLMLLFPSANAHIVILFVLGILGNIISGIFTPAAGAMLPHIVESEKLQQANAYFSIKSSLEGIVGVVLAGILYAALPIHTLFFMVGACFVASGISETLIRYEHIPSEGQLTLRAAFNDMKDGLNYLKTRKAILSLLGAMLFINFFFAPVGSNFIPYFVRTDLASAGSYLLDHILTPELWSSVISVCIGIGSLVGAAILSARKPAEKCGRTIGVCLSVIACLMISMTLIYWLAVDRGSAINTFLIAFSAGSLVLGLMVAWINVPATTVMMRIVDRDKLSKVNSITSIGSQGMVPIASVLAGAVLQSFGSTVLLLVSTLGFAVTAFLTLANKSVKEI
ncbi:MFS transporter [Aristaeella lactis]|uniref:Major Facilitator Superfamily protein n=1 Tax=Aristaeella lactis TaxID=3046383 RepID=A0AC61PQ64_9FIRM|nr:MFS transporter [Aristaeella lactis]QUA52253.1 MFS transporter [Aristaeella lactis]SMC90026.1 Major Facilitator Superfamily protein [Aristaeella lactis]